MVVLVNLRVNGDESDVIDELDSLILHDDNVVTDWEIINIWEDGEEYGE